MVATCRPPDSRRRPPPPQTGEPKVVAGSNIVMHYNVDNPNCARQAQEVLDIAHRRTEFAIPDSLKLALQQATAGQEVTGVTGQMKREAAKREPDDAEPVAKQSKCSGSDSSGGGGPGASAEAISAAPPVGGGASSSATVAPKTPSAKSAAKRAARPSRGERKRGTT